MANCRLCHAERLRLPAGDAIVSGLGSTHVRVHAYDAAFVHVARDPALSTEALLAAASRAAREHDLAWPEAFRVPIVRATVTALRERAEARGPEAERLASGLPGRVATIESFAMAMGARGAHVPPTATPGWAKIPDVRGFPWRDTLSWDGVGTGSPVALAAEADFAFGARPEWFETHRHLATSLYLYLKRFERRLPYPGVLDAALAARGRSAFDASCAKCHGTYAPDGPEPRVRYRERVVPVAVVGTDPARLEAVTPEFVAAANAIPLARGVTRTRRRREGTCRRSCSTSGRAGPTATRGSGRASPCSPRGPPSARASSPSTRTRRTTWRTWGCAGRRALRGGAGYVYDGEARGYGVQGHPFLSDLAADDRRAVLEYLKTL